MEESGNPEWSNNDEKKFKPRYRTSIITNTFIIILFFLSFCQIKGCSGDYSSVSGFQLSIGAIRSMVSLSPGFFFIGGVLIALVAAIFSLWFCFTNPEKMEKRAAICGITGCLGIAIFLAICSSEKGIILEWPPFMVCILHLINAIYYLIKPKKVEINSE